MTLDEVIDFLYSLRSYYLYVTFLTIPSFLLYLSEVVVIIKHKQLHNSFNILFAVRAIPNFLKMWGTMFGYRLPKIIGGFLLPFYKILPSTVLALYFFLLYFCFYADNFSTAAIQLNRFIAIAFPLHYEKIWLYLLPFCVLIIYGVPFYFSFCFFWRDTQIAVVNNDPYNFNGTTFSITGNTNQCSLDNSYLVRLLSIICLIFCTVLSLSTIFLYHYRKRHRILNLNNNSNTSDRIERNLLIYAMCTFVGLGFITLFFHSTNLQFLQVIGNFKELRFSLDGITHDSCNIVLPSWLMLWASSTFRQQWMADVLPKRWNLWKSETKTKTVDIRCRPLPTQTNGNRQTIPLPLFSVNRITVT